MTAPDQAEAPDIVTALAALKEQADAHDPASSPGTVARLLAELITVLHRHHADPGAPAAASTTSSSKGK